MDISPAPDRYPIPLTPRWTAVFIEPLPAWSRSGSSSTACPSKSWTTTRTPARTSPAFGAGFFSGNGLPYYVAGSTGDGINPSPFPDTPLVNVLVGCAAVAIGAVAWAFTDTASHPIAAYSSAGFGALTVGLIHSGNWRTNPWRKRVSVAAPPRA